MSVFKDKVLLITGGTGSFLSYIKDISTFPLQEVHNNK